MFPSLARFEHLGVFTRKPGFPAASQLLQDLRPRALARAHVVVAAAAQAMSHLGRASAVQCVPVPTWLVLLCYVPGGPLAAHRALTAFSRSSSLSTSRGSPVRGNVNPHGESKASLPVPPGGVLWCHDAICLSAARRPCLHSASQTTCTLCRR